MAEWRVKLCRWRRMIYESTRCKATIFVDRLFNRRAVTPVKLNCCRFRVHFGKHKSSCGEVKNNPDWSR